MSKNAFFRGKTGFPSKVKTPPKPTKTDKEGLGPSEVAVRATSPDP